MSLITSDDLSIKDIFRKFPVENKSQKPQFLYRIPRMSESWTSDSSSGYEESIPFIRKKTKNKLTHKLKQYCDEIMQSKTGIPFYIITWLICSYTSIMSTARFKIVDTLEGFAYQLNHLDIAVMFVAAQILYLGILMAKGKLALPWLITMFWALVSTEGPCIIEASHKIMATSWLGKATFVGLIIILFLKFILWIEVLIFTNKTNFSRSSSLFSKTKNHKK